MRDEIKITVVGGDKFADYISDVDERLKSDLDKSVETLAIGTKRVVKKYLFNNHGVDEGVYKKSII